MKSIDKISNIHPLLLITFGAIILGLFGWFGLGLGARDLHNTVPGQVGKVDALKGKATATGKGQERKLDSQAAIFIGDLVRTRQDSRLLLRLGKRTTLRLGAQSEVKIVRYLVDAGGELDLTAGAIEFERTGNPAPEPLSIRSTYGLIAVRGTQFFAGQNRGKFAVFVTRGQVAVTGTQSKTVILSKGQGTDIAAKDSPPTAPVLWGQARIDEALASVR